MIIPKHTPSSCIIHIYPLDDLRPHITDQDNRGVCWCRPTVEQEGAGYIVTHNAADGREAFETGQRKRS